MDIKKVMLFHFKTLRPRSAEQDMLRYDNAFIQNPTQESAIHRVLFVTFKTPEGPLGHLEPTLGRWRSFGYTLTDEIQLPDQPSLDSVLSHADQWITYQHPQEPKKWGATQYDKLEGVTLKCFTQAKKIEEVRRPHDLEPAVLLKRGWWDENNYRCKEGR